MLEYLLKIDEQLLVFLNNLGVESWDNFWKIFTEKYTHIPMLIVLLVLLFRALGTKRFFIAFLVLIGMATFTDQITNLAKYNFLRPRPCKVSELEGVIRFVAKRCSRYGYFSGHSSNSMALAISLGLLLKHRYSKLLYVLIFWALCMGYSRIYVGVHYPGDVLTGFIVGGLNGYLFYKLYKFIIQKYNIA